MHPVEFLEAGIQRRDIVNTAMKNILDLFVEIKDQGREGKSHQYPP